MMDVFPRFQDVLPTFDFSKIPLGRVGEPEEIAEAGVVQLALVH